MLPVSYTHLLSVENLAFSYDGRTPILTDIHMQVQKGEMLAIVGKNGAGKSTLSNLICGFLKPGQGRILFGGEDIADWSIKERGEKIGLVMQNPNQMISKPMIYDEVALGLAVRGVPEEEIKERVYATLKTVSYTHLDVYKRQPQDGDQDLHRGDALDLAAQVQ